MKQLHLGLLAQMLKAKEFIGLHGWEILYLLIPYHLKSDTHIVLSK